VSGVPWGLPIAGYLYLGGLAGGALMLAFVLDYYDRGTGRYYPVAKTAAYIAPVALALGMVLLVYDLARPIYGNNLFHVLNAFKNVGSSIMAVGTWIISVTLVLGLVNALFYFGNASRPLRLAVSLASAIGGFATAVYTGLLLAAARAYPSWYNPWLAWLFTASGVSTGIEASIICTRILGSATPSYVLPEFSKIRGEWASIAGEIHKYHNYVILGELVIFIAYLIHGAVLTPVAVAGVFYGPALPAIIAYLGLALAVPLATWKMEVSPAVLYTVAVLVLIGAFGLRYAVLVGPQALKAAGFMLAP